MADANAAGGPKQMLAQHGEKVGLAVAVVGLAVVAIWALGGGDDPLTEKVLAKSRKLADQRQVGHESKQPPGETVSVSSKVMDDWKVVAAVSDLESHKGTSRWAMSWPTLVRPIETTINYGLEAAVVLPTVTLEAPEVALDGISLKWTLNKPPATAMSRPIDPDSLLLERRVGKGNWEKLAELTAKDLAFKDTRITPKTTFAYRVTPKSKDAKAQKTARGSNEREARTLGIFSLRFQNPIEREGRMYVYVTIEKFDAEHGKVSESRLHGVGEKIGWWSDRPDVEPTSKHHIPLPGGRGATIDFDTGSVLKSVNPERGRVEFRQCKPEYDKDTGTIVQCTLEKQTLPWSGYRILWVDDEGRPQTDYVPEKKGPPDVLLCDEHGGGGRPQGPTPEEIERRKKERNDAATKLLQEADRSWNERKWKEAVARYEKLRRDFADTATYAGRKDDIAKRIAEGRKKPS